MPLLQITNEDLNQTYISLFIPKIFVTKGDPREKERYQAERESKMQRKGSHEKEKVGERSGGGILGFWSRFFNWVGISIWGQKFYNF